MTTHKPETSITRRGLLLGAAGLGATAAIGTPAQGAGATGRARTAPGVLAAPSWVYPRAALDLRFDTHQGWSSRLGNLAPSGQVTALHATPSYWHDAAGAWTRFEPDAIRRSNDGLGVESTGVNLVRAPNFAGAATGNPGTLPPGWSWTVPGGHESGLRASIVGLGTATNGLPYLDVRYSGTTTAGNGELQLLPGGTTPAAPGQAWTFSVFLQVVAGTFTGTVGLYLQEHNAGGVYLDSLPRYVTPTASATRFSNTQQLPDPSVGQVRCALVYFAPGAGTAVDFTLRYQCPQLERTAGATSPMPGVNLTVSPDLAGAALGSPGTLPAGWSWTVPGGHESGLRTSVVGLGTANGLPYLDVRYSGTTTAANGELQLLPGGLTPAAPGQAWSASAYLRVVAGAFSGGMSLYIQQFTAAGGYVDSLPVSFSPTATNTRYINRQRLSNPSVGQVQCVLVYFAPAAGTAVDFTLRHICPQLERSAEPTPPMPTPSRAGDSVTAAPASELLGLLQGGQGMIRLEFGPVAQVQPATALLDNAGFMTLRRTDDRTVTCLVGGGSGITARVGTMGFSASQTTGAVMATWGSGGRTLAGNGSPAAAGSTRAGPVSGPVYLGTDASLAAAINTSLKRVTIWSTVDTSVPTPYTSCFDNPFSTIARPTYFTGVNLAGLDFGGTFPGTVDRDYGPPNRAGYAYLKSKGFTYVRLPFKLERLFTTMATPGVMDVAYARLIDDAVAETTARGMALQLDPHNYCAYNIGGTTHGLGTAQFPVAAYAQMMGALAARYGGNPLVHFNLMNEPTADAEPGLTAAIWRGQADQAIRAIRATGTRNLIVIPGVGYTGGWTWIDKGNGAAWDGFTDVNFAFDVHQYLDEDGSGSHETVVTGAGASRLQYDFHNFANTGTPGVVPWARARGYKLMLGEFGTTRNVAAFPQAPIEQEALLDYIDANRDVFVGWSWWLMSERSDDWKNLEPANIGLPGQTDQPQMAALVAHRQ